MGVDLIYDDVPSIASNCLRSVICAPDGHKFISADYSNIEGRVLAWLAGEEWKVKAFKEYDEGEGHDIYKLAYSKSFGIKPGDVTGEQRQIGKTQELACGYQGWTGAFSQFAKLYNLELDDDTKLEVVSAWRDAHPKTVLLWKIFEYECINAVLSGNTRKILNNKIIIGVKDNYLLIKLPSGRFISYPKAVVIQDLNRNKQVLKYYGLDSFTRKWGMMSTYGGKLVENAVQGISRDILAEAMLRLEANNYPIVLTVHDEIICEVEDTPNKNLDEMNKLMKVVPEWAEGLPIAVTGYEAKRYRK